MGRKRTPKPISGAPVAWGVPDWRDAKAYPAPGDLSLRQGWWEFTRRRLRRGGDLIPVEPKVFDLLVHLISNREKVVSKDDLITAIWQGRVISAAALSSCINSVRVALGDSGSAQNLIKTLPRKGVRFIGAVREEPETEHRPAQSANAAPPLQANLRLRCCRFQI